MNGRDLEGFVGFLTGSLGDFLERRFESDEVRRLMLANSLYGKHGGPFQAGTAVGLLFHLLSGGEGAEQGWSGHVIGGMGAVSDAIAAAAAAAGAEIRTGAAVQRIRSADHGPARVQLADGTEVSARIVVSNADPKRTFLDLIDPGELEDDFRRSIAAIRMDGPCAKVNFVLDREPQVAGMPDDRTKQQRSLITLVPTLEEAERSYGMSRAGRLPDDLWIDCVLASNVDPDLVTSGRHVMTCFVQFVPYRLQGAGWDEQREVFGDAVAARIERYMPGFRNSVVARRVLTPLDLEQDYGISEGNIFHGDPGLDQLFFMRPLPGWAQYRTPLPGIYLCGAGTHPGGGVTAAPGYNAAQCIIRDLA
jgi:phytoene dehydrogenase-like protein